MYDTGKDEASSEKSTDATEEAESDVYTFEDDVSDIDSQEGSSFAKSNEAAIPEEDVQQCCFGHLCSSATTKPSFTLELDKLLPEADSTGLENSSPKPETPLRASAVAWQPAIDTWSLTQTLDQSVAKAVSMVKMALEASGATSNVDAFQVGHGWKIVASRRRGYVGTTDSILVVAKVALLRAAEESKCTYVLGYESKAFEAKAGGFSCWLANMEDEHRACWNFYGKGFCTQGSRCHWHHPKKMAIVEALVEE